MGTVALALGVLLVLVVIASQTGVLGGHDFLSVAMAGLAFAAFAVVAAVRTEGAERARALGSLGLLPARGTAWLLLRRERWLSAVYAR